MSGVVSVRMTSGAWELSLQLSAKVTYGVGMPLWSHRDRHAHAADPVIGSLERRSRKALATLHGQLAERLSREFGTQTSKAVSYREHGHTPRERRAWEREYWRNVAHFASTVVLRAAADLAPSAPATERGERPKHILAPAALAKEAWAVIDQDHFIEFTGLNRDASQRAIEATAVEVVAWAAKNQQVIVPYDDVYVVVGANAGRVTVSIASEGEAKSLISRYL